MENYLTSTNFDQDVEFIDGFITNENGTQSNFFLNVNINKKLKLKVRLENSCLLYEYLDICQNNGVCVVMPSGVPACS